MSRTARPQIWGANMMAHPRRGASFGGKDKCAKTVHRIISGKPTIEPRMIGITANSRNVSPVPGDCCHPKPASNASKESIAKTSVTGRRKEPGVREGAVEGGASSPPGADADEAAQSRSRLMPFRLMNLACPRPIFGARDKAMPHRICPHVFPFRRITFTASQLCVPKIVLRERMFFWPRPRE